MSGATIVAGEPRGSVLERHPSLPYVLPFGAFMILLALKDYTALIGRWDYPLRAAVLIAVLWTCSRGVLRFRTVRPAASVLAGLALFVLWIGPDLLFPGYRQHWLFQNRLTGEVASSIPANLTLDPMVLVFRSVRAVFLVPVIEELFWRAWLLRWLVNTRFYTLPIGAWTPTAFVLTAILFASEHGPYWDVGLLAGCVFNWWIIRTRSLGDCIVMHAVTNACLSAYVISGGKWEYWL